MARIIVLGGFAESLVNFRGALLREMVAGGHEVYACAPEASTEIKSILEGMGVIYRSVSFDRTGLSFIHDLFSIKNLIALFKEIKPDIFLGYTIKSVIYGSIAARISGVPSKFSMITGLGYSFSDISLKSKLVGKVASILYFLALRFNKKVFFQNSDDVALFLKKGILRSSRQAVLINGSGVDIDEYYPVAYPPSISFLLVARLIRDKGIYEYVYAAGRVREKYPDVKFRLVGWIDKNPYAIDEQDLQEWQDSGCIDFLGRLTDVRPAIKDCSVYVLPSYREGMPRTVLEAMAMGRPIITTDAPGCRETVIQGFNGYMVPVRDVDSLVEVMETYIEQSELVQKMGQNSRKIIEEKYDVRKVNAVILKTMGLL